MRITNSDVFRFRGYGRTAIVHLSLWELNVINRSAILGLGRLVR